MKGMIKYKANKQVGKFYCLCLIMNSNVIWKIHRISRLVSMNLKSFSLACKTIKKIVSLFDVWDGEWIHHMVFHAILVYCFKNKALTTQSNSFCLMSSWSKWKCSLISIVSYYIKVCILNVKFISKNFGGKICSHQKFLFLNISHARSHLGHVNGLFVVVYWIATG